MSRPFRLLCSSLVLLVLATAAPAAAPSAVFQGPTVAGQLGAPPNNETSGIAASQLTPGLLWVHDDSDGAPMLYAVGADGARRGTLQIGGGVKNVDWEDLAAAILDGKSWLIIGDIGDNFAKRQDLQIHFVEEPSAERLGIAGMLAQSPAASLQLRYEDGPRDCESLAIDVRERALYLLSKREPIPRLYRVALPSPLASGEVVARFVGPVSHLPQPTPEQARLPNILGRFRAWPCAMDFTTDGSAAVVVTYGDTLLFPRRPDETWAQALNRTPVRLPPHDLPQAEAVCFSPDGRRLFVASEKTRTLLRYDRP